MEIKCVPIAIPDPQTLPLQALPTKDRIVSPINSQLPNLQFLTDILGQFSAEGDGLLAEIFGDFFIGRRFIINCVATQGISEPYDAWCAEYNGRRSFFFNLSLWTAEDLKRSGLAVIKHEITHILLCELLPETDISNPLKKLERIIIDEGLAHFIGFPKNRETLLVKHTDKWIAAEKELAAVQAQLSNMGLPPHETEQLIQRADTESYWKKYAAISGMFRAAKTYQTSGAAGLRNCIKTGALPKQIFS
jgi:hypothetical protein